MFTVHPSFVHRKQEFLEKQEFFAQFTATMFWNEEDDSFYLEHNYLLTLKQYIWAP